MFGLQVAKTKNFCIFVLMFACLSSFGIGKECCFVTFGLFKKIFTSFKQKFFSQEYDLAYRLLLDDHYDSAENIVSEISSEESSDNGAGEFFDELAKNFANLDGTSAFEEDLE